MWLTDAGHCPGSVMFLFEGAFGVYFHTGDFRFNRGMLSCPVIKRAQGMVDKLFIDTTFCSPFWSAFPPKEQAIAQVLQIISSQPHNVQVYLECEMLGTQDVLVAVAEKFKTKIFVEDEKLRESFKCVPELKRAKIFAADPLESRFHLLKNQRYTNRTEVLLEPDALYIRPSTQWFGQQGNGRGNPALYQTRPCYAHGIWHVLYSIHSSFEELEVFVSFLQPRGLVPLTECSAVALKRLTSSCLTNVGGAASASGAADPSSAACRLRPPVTTTTTTTTTLHRHLSASSLVALAREAEYDDQPPEPKRRVVKNRRLTTALKRTTATTTEPDFCEDFIMAALDRPNSRKRPLDGSPPVRPRPRSKQQRPVPAAPEPARQLQGSPRTRPTRRALSDPGIRAAAATEERHHVARRKVPAEDDEEKEEDAEAEVQEKRLANVDGGPAAEMTRNGGAEGEREKSATTDRKNTPALATSGGWMSKRRREPPPPSSPPPSATTAMTTDPPGECRPRDREEAGYTEESLLQELCALEHHTAEVEETSECWRISDDDEAEAW